MNVEIIFEEFRNKVNDLEFGCKQFIDKYDNLEYNYGELEEKNAELEDEIKELKAEIEELKKIRRIKEL